MQKFPEHGYVEADDKQIYYWKASSLWALSKTMPMIDIALDSFDWTNENFQCNSLSNPPLWRDIGDHAKRIFNADLQYPIVMSAEGNIMDGMHRILKAYVMGHETIKAVRFAENPKPDIVYPKDV